MEPIPLSQWVQRNSTTPEATLVNPRLFWHVINFVRDTLPKVLTRTATKCNALQSKTEVIGMYELHDICLPIVRIKLPDGTALFIAYNDTWKVSVISPRDVEVDFMGLFDPSWRVSPNCCPNPGLGGFLTHRPFVKDRKHFTLELPDQRIWTFFWLFAYKVLGIQDNYKG